jgi:alpha-1,6-mannosyltransferase
VEESFNIQATHDFITYSSRSGGLFGNLKLFDHVSFPGAVPRSFVGALGLAIISNPIISLTGPEYAQFVVRAVLGLLNAYALFRFKERLAKAFGNDVGRWYILFQVSQFHVMFYASRTLPNMFAFGLSLCPILLLRVHTDISSYGGIRGVPTLPESYS